MPAVHTFKAGEGESFDSYDAPQAGDYLRFNRLLGGIRCAARRETRSGIRLFLSSTLI